MDQWEGTCKRSIFSPIADACLVCCDCLSFPAFPHAPPAQVELPRFSATDLLDFEDRFLNSRINNKDERPFLEREAVVESVVKQLEQIRRKGSNKPTVLALWSPRGTGKTSLIRHLALNVPNFAESRGCGRLLVFDAVRIPSALWRKDPDLLASAIILWHLCRIFDGYSVEVSQGPPIGFQSRTFSDLVITLESSRLSQSPPAVDSFEAWVHLRCKTKEAVFEQWLSVTSAAFNATPDCACLVFLDQAELLVNRQVEGLSHHGGQKSAFTEIFGEFPQKMGMFSAGTVSILTDRPSEEYTSLKVQEVPALAPLSLQAARRAMAEWGGMQYKKKEFDNIHLFSAGVPRLSRPGVSWHQLLGLHSMPCRRSSEARMRMQPPTSISQKWLWRWFFARRFDGLQKATSLCPEPQ